MKKKINLLFSFVVMVCLVVCLGVNASAADIVETGSCGAEGDNVTWTLYDDGLVVVSGTGAIADSSTMFNKGETKKVVIEDGVTRIGVYAFAACVNLESVVIPESVTSIGLAAFGLCESLTDITIPDGVTEIADATFSSCTSLTNIIIPDGVTSIGESAFENCESLVSITIPYSVTSIGDSAFWYCDSLTDVNYYGAEEDWNKITIAEYNESLLEANINFLGEVETDTSDETTSDTDEEAEVFFSFIQKIIEWLTEFFAKLFNK